MVEAVFGGVAGGVGLALVVVVVVVVRCVGLRRVHAVVPAGREARRGGGSGGVRVEQRRLMGLASGGALIRETQRGRMEALIISDRESG